MKTLVEKPIPITTIHSNLDQSVKANQHSIFSPPFRHFFNFAFSSFTNPVAHSLFSSSSSFTSEMEQMNSSSSLNKLLLKTFSAIFRPRKTPKDRLHKLKYQDKIKNHSSNSSFGYPPNRSFIEENEKKMVMEAVFAKLFASISSIKAAYAQLQIAESPYDPEQIQLADELVVSELKLLSELKQSYLKKQKDSSPQVTVLLAELKEQKSVLKSYEIMGKKLDSQFKLKDSEILFLKEKLEECDKQNELLEQQVDHFDSFSVLDNVKLSELGSKHFVIVHQRVVESIRSFVKLVIKKMSSSGWDIGAAVNSLEPGMRYGKLNERRLAFESFVCREIFGGFQYSNFSSLNERQCRNRRRFFDKFMEMKSRNAMEMLKVKPGSSFGKFCRVKYLGLVHSKMELSFFGNLNQRNVVNSGGYPETGFFTSFVEMAKNVWLLHCLAFSFDPEVSIFQVAKGCRFSEVFMENVVEHGTDELPGFEPSVGFTVIPGFNIGKIVVQCKVYLSSLRVKCGE